MIHIAIIGSGAAGCYLADHLLRLVPDAAIDIIEQLPVPFGLVRYGVAPDHQSTKAVAASCAMSKKWCKPLSRRSSARPELQSLSTGAGPTAECGARIQLQAVKGGTHQRLST
jgi:NADPH-dependent glutamate synthase beta subunit-like oxidoreductase